MSLIQKVYIDSKVLENIPEEYKKDLKLFNYFVLGFFETYGNIKFGNVLNIQVECIIRAFDKKNIIKDIRELYKIKPTSFNQNIGTWDVSNVTTLANTFDGATSFNQNLSGWDISGLSSSSSLNNFMRSVTLSSTNYDSLLNNWNTNKASYRNDLVPNFGISKYSSAASGARAGLIAYGWVITDGGIV